MKIGDEVHVHGYVDEIRNDVVIIRNKGGYFGTAEEEVLLTDISELQPSNERRRRMKLYDADATKEYLLDNRYKVEPLDRTGKRIQDRPTGKWIVEEHYTLYDKTIRLKCSECGDTFNVSERAYPHERYCRYCGAKMSTATKP